MSERDTQRDRVRGEQFSGGTSGQEIVRDRSHARRRKTKRSEWEDGKRQRKALDADNHLPPLF